MFGTVCCNDKVYAITNGQQLIEIDILVNNDHSDEDSSAVEINLSHCTQIPGSSLGNFYFYLVGSLTELFICCKWQKVFVEKVFVEQGN